MQINRYRSYRGKHMHSLENCSAGCLQIMYMHLLTRKTGIRFATVLNKNNAFKFRVLLMRFTGALSDLDLL